MNRLELERLEEAKVRVPKEPLDGPQLCERLVPHTGVAHWLLLALLLLTALPVLSNAAAPPASDALALPHPEQLAAEVLHPLVVALLPPMAGPLSALHVGLSVLKCQPGPPTVSPLLLVARLAVALLAVVDARHVLHAGVAGLAPLASPLVPPREAVQLPRVDLKWPAELALGVARHRLLLALPVLGWVLPLPSLVALLGRPVHHHQ